MKSDSPLEALILDIEACQAREDVLLPALDPEGPPLPATFQIVKSDVYTSLKDRKPTAGALHEISLEGLRLRSVNNLLRGFRLSIHAYGEKSPQGETFYDITATVARTQKASGGYESECRLDRIHRVVQSARRRLLEFTWAQDVTGWNRWSAELNEGADLQGIRLGGASLAHFDLCCADLRGADLSNCDLTRANLSGADLTGSRLDGARVQGTDFFRCRLPRAYMGLLLPSGMVEVESVIFV